MLYAHTHTPRLCVSSASSSIYKTTLKPVTITLQFKCSFSLCCLWPRYINSLMCCLRICVPQNPKPFQPDSCVDTTLYCGPMSLSHLSFYSLSTLLCTQSQLLFSRLFDPHLCLRSSRLSPISVPTERS